MANSTEEVLFKVRDFCWPTERYWDATLITYEGLEEKTFHMQTHEFHTDSLILANAILAKRGLAIGVPVLLGPSGQYYKVIGAAKKG